jgi:hypothetical protein
MNSTDTSIICDPPPSDDRVNNRRKRSRRIGGCSPESKVARHPAVTDDPSVVRCIDFGQDRVTRYPDYWFCRQCQNVEHETAAGCSHGNTNFNSRYYACRANHEAGSLFPTSTCNPLDLIPEGNEGEAVGTAVVSPADDGGDPEMPELCPRFRERPWYCSDTSDDESDYDSDSSYDEDHVEPGTLLVADDESADEDDESADEAARNRKKSEDKTKELIRGLVQFSQDQAKKIKSIQEELTEAKKELATERKTKISGRQQSSKATISNLQKTVDGLRQKVHSSVSITSRLKKELDESLEKVNNLEQELGDPNSKEKAGTFAGRLKDAVDEFVTVSKAVADKSRSSRTATELARGVAIALWDDSLLKGKLQGEFLRLAKKHLRKHVFSGPKILRMMDMHGGTVSYEAIRLLRELETGGEKWKHNTVIPSTSELKRCAAIVEKYGDKVCPFTITTLPGEQDGECISFCSDPFGLFHEQSTIRTK